MRPITQQMQTVQALEAAGASRQLAEAIAATVEVAAQASRDAAWERIEAKFDALRAEMNGRFDQVEVRFGEMNGRFGEMNGRFGEMIGRIATVEANLERSFRVTTVSLVVFVLALAGLMLAVLRFFPAPH